VTFNYTAKSKTGERVAGTIEAGDRIAAIRAVERLGYVPIAFNQETGRANASIDRRVGQDASAFSTEPGGAGQALLPASHISSPVSLGADAPSPRIPLVTAPGQSTSDASVGSALPNAVHAARQRHWCLTTFLLLLSISSLGSAIQFHWAMLEHGPDGKEWIPWLCDTSAGTYVVSAIALFCWKKWGFYSYVATASIMFVVSLILGGATPIRALLGFSEVAMRVAGLYGVLHVGKGKAAWPQLEPCAQSHSDSPSLSCPKCFKKDIQLPSKWYVFALFIVAMLVWASLPAKGMSRETVKDIGVVLLFYAIYRTWPRRHCCKACGYRWKPV